MDKENHNLNDKYWQKKNLVQLRKENALIRKNLEEINNKKIAQLEKQYLEEKKKTEEHFMKVIQEKQQYIGLLQLMVVKDNHQYSQFTWHQAPLLQSLTKESSKYKGTLTHTQTRRNSLKNNPTTQMIPPSFSKNQRRTSLSRHKIEPANKPIVRVI